MKIIALKNFKAGRIHLEKGTELTPEQVENVLPLIDELLNEKLVFVVEDDAVKDDGPKEPKDEVPEVVEELPAEEPKAKKKK